VNERIDGCDFELRNAKGTYALGAEDDPHETGPFTVCTVVVPATSDAPRFLLELRPRQSREHAAVARGDAIHVDLGDAAFEHAFVVEGAPAHAIRLLLEARVRAALLGLAPVRVALTADKVTLRKWGTWVEPGVVRSIVQACLELRGSAMQLPEQIARSSEPAGYRGERLTRPEEDAKATLELSELERVRRTRRQIAGANVGLVILAIVVFSVAGSWCSHP
jgi:hypothetical protein